jgi:predicted nuclease with TOPRIM domain
MNAQTEAQTQAEAGSNDSKKLRELRAENHRLKQELEYVKEKLNECQRESERFSKYIELLELVVSDLLSVHYGGKVRVNFETFDLCLDDRCITFNRYEDFIAGLRAAILILK